MNWWVIIHLIWLLVGILNAIYWEKSAMETERLSTILSPQAVKTVYFLMMIVAAPYVLIFDTIPDLWVSFIVWFKFYMIRRKVNKLLRKKGLKDRV